VESFITDCPNLVGFSVGLCTANEDSAYVHFYEVMDKYNNTLDVYSDWYAGGNHYFPSGWYNGDDNMAFDDDWREDFHNGFSCIKVIWNGLLGDDGWKWNGIIWQEPEGNWVGNNGLGYDLTGATKLSFWAKTDDPGLRLIYMVGYPNDSCDEVCDTTAELTTSWTYHDLDLSGRELSDICGGFAFIFTDVLDPNPNGCTFYLDDIKYTLARPDSLRFLLSHETNGSINDKYWAINQCYAYDNALAMLSFLARGTDEDLRRARIIGDAFAYVQNHDSTYSDSRLRNAYMSGDVGDHQTGYVRLPGWWDDSTQAWSEDGCQVGSYAFYPLPSRHWTGGNRD